MSLEPFKFIVQAVLLETDEAGAATGERVCDPVALFGCDQLEQWAREFPAKLAAAVASPAD